MFAPNVAKNAISSMLAVIFRSVEARAMLIADCKKDIVSLEYGLHHSLLFYAGSLGFLATDHINECSIAVSDF